MKYHSPLLRTLALSLSLVLFFVGTAQGASISIVVTPTRIVLDDRHRSEDIQVISLTRARLNYDVGTAHFIQLSDGTMGAAKQMTKRQQLAEKMVRFSPRRATLAPRGTQIVRVVYRLPKGVPDGEYRLHMSVQPSPADETIGEGAGEGGEGQSIVLDIYIGMSIPIFIRVGETSATVNVTEATFTTAEGDAKKPALKVGFTREGNRSVYGDINVVYTPSGGGEARVIGKRPGIPIYHPNRKLDLVIPLDLKEGETLRSLAGGTMQVVYVDAEGDGGEELASSTFNL